MNAYSIIIIQLHSKKKERYLTQPEINTDRPTFKLQCKTNKQDGKVNLYVGSKQLESTRKELCIIETCKVKMLLLLLLFSLLFYSYFYFLFLNTIALIKGKFSRIYIVITGCRASRGGGSLQNTRARNFRFKRLSYILPPNHHVQRYNNRCTRVEKS